MRAESYHYQICVLTPFQAYPRFVSSSDQYHLTRLERNLNVDDIYTLFPLHHPGDFFHYDTTTIRQNTKTDDRFCGAAQQQGGLK